MTERDDNAVASEHILQLKDELMARWQQLPTEHQATMALVLLRDVLGSEYGDWMWGALLVLGRGEELADGETPATRSP